MTPPSVGGHRRLWRWAKRSLIALAAAAVALVGLDRYVVATTRPAIVADVAAAPVRPDAVVLGNRVLPDGTPCDELAARLGTALELYRAGRAGKLVVSGRVWNHYDEPAGMAAWLIERGVPAADVVVDPGGYRTAATMADTAALGKRSILVVTQSYHLPRALYLARRAGIDAIGVPAPSRRRGSYDRLKVSVREIIARAESVLEVAFRGVRSR
jgi:vancomycin permeability regulator SanA